MGHMSDGTYVHGTYVGGTYVVGTSVDGTYVVVPSSLSSSFHSCSSTKESSEQKERHDRKR